MGGAASKVTRKLPKRVEAPSWAGARTPHPTAEQEQRASEVKTEDIRRDAQDPHFLANLNRLGPVRVDHHMQTIRPAQGEMSRLFESRTQSEAEAVSSQSVHNHLHGLALSELFDKRKSAKTRLDVERLAVQYDIDVAKLESLARFVNSPSIEMGMEVRTVDKDGNESITMKAIWVEPRLRILT